MTVNYCGILTKEIIALLTMVNYYDKLLQQFYNIAPWLHFLFQLVDEGNFKGMNEVHAGMKPELLIDKMNEIELNERK